MWREKLRGFYAVLDRNDERMARRLLSSARVLQVRMKSASLAGVAQCARMARRITADTGALLIVNDHLDIALEVKADGVHLGQGDLPIEAARRSAPRGFLIGISTHGLAQVEEALAGGADYLGFGPVYATRTKADPDPVQGVGALRAAVAAAGEIPVVAIGGITPARAAEVAAAGAAAACAIGSVNQAPDPAAAASLIAGAFRA